LFPCFFAIFVLFAVGFEIASRTSDFIRISDFGLRIFPPLPYRLHLMNLTNDSYAILMGTKKFTERYYRDQAGWLKVSARGRTFRMTAEQVLNHLLPAVAGLKPNLMLKVEHHDPPARQETKGTEGRRASTARRRPAC
jgi:hypothetical protein